MSREEKLAAIVDAFIREQKITCAETVYQTDRVIVAAYDFIAELCSVAGYLPDPYPYADIEF